VKHAGSLDDLPASETVSFQRARGERPWRGPGRYASASLRRCQLGVSRTAAVSAPRPAVGADAAPARRLRCLTPGAPHFAAPALSPPNRPRSSWCHHPPRSRHPQPERAAPAALLTPGESRARELFVAPPSPRFCHHVSETARPGPAGARAPNSPGASPTGCPASRRRSPVLFPAVRGERPATWRATWTPPARLLFHRRPQWVFAGLGWPSLLAPDGRPLRRVGDHARRTRVQLRLQLGLRACIRR